jgi:flagellar basal body-associated protein FliL
MAEDRKTDPALDDWDNIPLDPTANDDWDEGPAAPPQTPSDEPPVQSGEAPPPSTADDAPADDDFDDDDLDAPSPPLVEDAKPRADGQIGRDQGPFDAFLGENAEGENFVQPSATPFQPGEPAPEPAPAKGDDDKAEAQPGQGENQPEDESLESMFGLGSPLPKKVELDIEGTFFENLAAQETPAEILQESPSEEPAAQPEPAPADEEPPPAEPPPPVEPAPPEAPARHKIPLVKLLILALPALVVLAGLGWAIHRLFLYTPPPPPPILVIDPTVPAREMEPGALPLNPFYINFVGDPETIVEMAVQLFYNDVPDRELVEANLPLVREIIFRLTKNKGNQVVTSGELQRALRRELLQAINAALEAEAISYVQLTQFRILR